MKDKKQIKFSFEQMKAGATSSNPAIRKKTFQEYYERFEEFPSYLFDNTHHIDIQLFQTIQDLSNDPSTSRDMHKAIAAMLQRLPAHDEIILAKN